MGYILFFPALYCLADAFLSFRLKARLTPSSLSYLLYPASFLSSAKSILLPFSLCALLLWFFPLLSLAIILFAKWPHPFLLAYREFKQRLPTASFPLSTQPPHGPKLFDIRTDDKPHILFVFLESFRAKNVGSLGASLPLSPHFDKLAQEGILFSHFHSVGNRTNRATIASLFGIPPAHHPSHLNRYYNFSLIGLPQILAKHGYQSALIQGGSTSFDYEADFFAKQGFKTIVGKREIAKPGTSWGVFDEYLMPHAASRLAEQKTPSFLNIYTITNHHPWIHPQNTHGFLNTFAYTDSALGLLIEELKKRDLLKKSILFILGDHGQELEDRDSCFELNRHLYQDNVHVPLLIYAEGRITTPKVIDTVSSQIDLLPTVLDLFNLSEPHHSLGKSLCRPSASPIFFSHPLDTPIRGCRHENWKYLQQADGEELYDLSKDPDEKNNLIGDGHPLRELTNAHFAELERLYSGQPPEKKESPLHLDFTNSLQINDNSLKEIAQKHPDLSSICLANCHLITDTGIASLLHHCPKLEKLIIDGLDEVTGTNWGPAPHLVHLKAFDCPRMTLDWVSELPALKIIQFGSFSMTDEDLLTFAQKQKKLAAIYFSNLYGITDRGFKPLLEKNTELVMLTLKSCPLISNASIDAIQSKIFRYKFIYE